MGIDEDGVGAPREAAMSIPAPDLPALGAGRVPRARPSYMVWPTSSSRAMTNVASQARRRMTSASTRPAARARRRGRRRRRGGSRGARGPRRRRGSGPARTSDRAPLIAATGFGAALERTCDQGVGQALVPARSRRQRAGHGPGPRGRRAPRRRTRRAAGRSWSAGVVEAHRTRLVLGPGVDAAARALRLASSLSSLTERPWPPPPARRRARGSRALTTARTLSKLTEPLAEGLGEMGQVEEASPTVA